FASRRRHTRFSRDWSSDVCSSDLMDPHSENTIMVVSEQGYGKRTHLDDDDGEPVYRITNRGGKGVKTMNVTDKTGKLVAIKSVRSEERRVGKECGGREEQEAWDQA